MSRKARIHVPGGLYYVIQRGNAGLPIFTDVADYAHFERLLGLMLERCRMRVHAYCWMPHSIHLAIQISELPLGRLMQPLTSQYAREVHRHRGESGHLFRERYQALLVDAEAYLPQLVRHVHRLPLQAGLAASIDAYPFCSHRAYLGTAHVPWLTSQLVMRRVGEANDRVHAAQERYGELMHEVPKADAPNFERGGEEDPRVLGDERFMDALPRQVRVVRSRHSLDAVIDTISHTLAVERAQVLSRSRQRRLTLARALVAWYATERGIATLAQVARRLQRDPSTLFAGVVRYRSLRPDLFDFGALKDRAPLLRLAVDTKGESRSQKRQGRAAQSPE